MSAIAGRANAPTRIKASNTIHLFLIIPLLEEINAYLSLWNTPTSLVPHLPPATTSFQFCIFRTLSQRSLHPIQGKRYQQEKNHVFFPSRIQFTSPFVNPYSPDHHPLGYSTRNSTSRLRPPFKTPSGCSMTEAISFPTRSSPDEDGKSAPE